jgi:DNA-directed RNA polymerase subunit RPC12/RpoP
MNHDHDDVELVTCPACGQEQDEAEAFLGRLGWLTHYRCRYCGMPFSRSPLAADIQRVGQEIRS